MPLAKGLLSGKYKKNSIFGKSDPRNNNHITEKIINYTLSKKNLNFNKVIKWPLKSVKKIVFSVKNLNQLKQITNIK